MDHAPEIALSRGVKRGLAIAAAVLAVVTMVGVALLAGTDEPEINARQLGLNSQVFAAEVVSVRLGPCAGTAATDRVPCYAIGFRPEAGPDSGSRLRFEIPKLATSPDLSAGDQIVVSYDRKAEPGFRYQYNDRQRGSVLWWLFALFALAVIALGRWRGLAALVGLGASFAVLLFFVLPALVAGQEPVLVALTGASAIAFLALYVAHGFNFMTTVALLGTLVALVITVLLAMIFVDLAHLTGFTSDEAFVVQVGTSGGISITGLVLAGMVLGALGALDDVTVTQASAVWELRDASPDMSVHALARAGLRIGRDHVASTVNTLALAYAGAALPLLILFVFSRQSLGTIANSEVIATEIIATLVGSIGLVAAVPITTWLAAAVLPRRLTSESLSPEHDF